MRVIMFQPRFHQLILDGVKLSTIRDKARCKPGDVLSLRKWTGLPYRSKQEVLREVVCRDVSEIRISHDGCQTYGSFAPQDRLARMEGFKDWPDMLAWFSKNKTLPYTGWLIQWGK